MVINTIQTTRALLVILKMVKLPLAWLLITLPIAIATNYAYRISVDIPYFDEWTLVPLIEKWYEGHGSWYDLFQPYVAHEVSYVIPLAKGAALLSAKLFHWDVRFEIAVGFAMLLATSIIFAMYARRIGALSSAASSVTILLPISLLLLSLRQFENLTGPWGIAFFGVIFFVMATAYLLSQSNGLPWLIAAMVCAVLASLTFTNGLLAWPLGLAALIVQSRRLHAAMWVLAGAIFLSLFFSFMYVFVTYDHSKVTIGLVFLRFFSVLGGSLSMDKSIITAGASGTAAQPDFDMAAIVGLSLFLISCFLLWVLRRNARLYIVPVIGVIFSLSSCMMLAYGRADFGLGQVFSSRYIHCPFCCLCRC